MNDSEKTKLNKLIIALCTAFNREFSPILVEVFYTALQDLPVEQVEVAVNKWISALGKKFPTPVDLREAIHGDPKARSYEALQILVKAMEQSGSYKSVAFEDKAIMAAIENYGGWPEICAQYRELTHDNLSYWEHHFREIYQAASARGWQPKESACLGIVERHNLEHAHEFTRGKLPEPEVDVYSKQGKLTTSEPKQLSE